MMLEGLGNTGAMRVRLVNFMEEWLHWIGQILHSWNEALISSLQDQYTLLLYYYQQ